MPFVMHMPSVEASRRRIAHTRRRPWACVRGAGRLHPLLLDSKFLPSCLVVCGNSIATAAVAVCL